MNAFHVIGGMLALWAVLVTVLGITREGFPASETGERIVTVVSVLLALAAISSAVITSATEGDEKKGGDTASLTVR
ncbi:MAG: hypothetical protein ACR2J6_02060 [Thermoleophilaceae bacterium]